MPQLLATLGQQYEIIAGTGIAENKSVTFDGSSNIGLVGTHTLFRVTGMVAVKVYAVGVEQLYSNGGTIEVGTSTSTAGLIAQTTASALIANEIWHDNSPDQTLELSSVSTEKIITRDIILTVGTAAVVDGSFSITCIWKPLSSGALVVAVTDSSPSLSASPSSSTSASVSPSSSVSASLSPSSSSSPSSSASPSASVSRSLSPSSSASASLSPSSSASRSLSPSSSASASLSPSASVSLSLSPSSSASASLSPSASVSRSLSPSASASPSSSTSPSDLGP